MMIIPKKISQLKFFPSEDQSLREVLALKISFILVGLSFLILAFFWKKLPPKAPLFYTKPWGEEQLAKDYFLWLLPGLSLIFTLLNWQIANLLFKNQLFLSQLIIWGNVTVCLLSSITLVRILQIIV